MLARLAAFLGFFVFVAYFYILSHPATFTTDKLEVGGLALGAIGIILHSMIETIVERRRRTR